MARKSVPLKTAPLTPAPMYASGKPPVPAELQTAPRPQETGSNGQTGGNFKAPSVSTGPGQTQQGLDSKDPSQ